MSKKKLFTIGHGTREEKEFFSLLEKNGIKLLLDIRSKPYSKWNPQFNKGEIKKNCEIVGIRYAWVGNYLGGFGKHGSEKWNEGLEKLRRTVKKGKELPCIMCSERDEKQCHRYSWISADLQGDKEMEILHIDKNGETKYHEAIIKCGREAIKKYEKSSSKKRWKKT